MKFGSGKFVFGLLIGFATITGVQGDDFAALDEALPSGGNTARYAPVFDFDDDSCYPAAGFARFGSLNGGAGCDGSVTSHCQHSKFRDFSNTLHRWACIEDDTGSYCGHVYELYFEKDQTVDGCGGFSPEGGHKHDWELATVWTKDGVITHVTVSAHGGRNTIRADEVLFWGLQAGWEEECRCCYWYGPEPDPDDGVREHVMVVYHKDGTKTHAMRFAEHDDALDPENILGCFKTPPVISWYHFTGDAPFESNRDFREWLILVADHSHLSSTSVIGGRFILELNKYRPRDVHETYPEFTQASIEAANPNKPVLQFVEGDGAFSGEGTDYFLDFGKVPRGRHRLIAELAVMNDVDESADSLDVDFDTTATAPYLCTGCNNFTGLAWGEFEGIVVEIPTAGHALGVVTGKIVLQPRGLVDTGFREPQEPITLAMSMEIVQGPDDGNGGNGGGDGNIFGCTLSPNRNLGGFDPTMISMVMIAFIYIGMRHRKAHHSS